MRVSARSIVLMSALSGVTTHSALAQTSYTAGAAPLLPASSPARPVTAGEGERLISLLDEGQLRLLSDDGRHVLPADSLGPVLFARAAQWLSQLAPNAMTGVQAEYAGLVAARLGRDTAAVRFFDARLAGTKLTETERAYTLFVGARQLVKGMGTPDALRAAGRYVAALDQMKSPDVRPWQYRIHVALAARARDIGSLKEAIAQYDTAFNHLPTVSFEQRVGLIASGDHLVDYAALVAGQPDGRARIDAAVALLKRQLVPPDSTYVELSQRYAFFFDRAVQLTEFLGRQAPPVIATNWFNAPPPVTTAPNAPNARALLLGDGTIRMLEFGDFACAACVAALPAVEEFVKQQTTIANAPRFEAWYITHTRGDWGTPEDPPAVEVEKLRRFYLDEHKTTLPMAVWAGPKEVGIDGGILPKPSPNDSTYSISVTPTFVLVDRHGIVRHLEVGWTKEAAERMADRIALLRREATNAN